MIYSNSPQQVGAEIEMIYKQQSYPRTQPSAITNTAPSTTITEESWAVFNIAEETSKQNKSVGKHRVRIILRWIPNRESTTDISQLGLQVF